MKSWKGSKDLIALILLTILVAGGFVYLTSSQANQKLAKKSNSAASRARAIAKRQRNTMTNAEFANAVIVALGIEMPENTKKLSGAALFDVQSNLLAEKGIDSFIDTNSNKIVTKSDLCNLLRVLNEAVVNSINPSSARSNASDLFYDPISGYSKTPPSEASDYLVRFGCDISEGGDQPVNPKEVIAALSDPRYSALVAEAYSDPRSIGRGPVIVGPQNPIPEDDPGKISEEGPASRT